MQVSYRIRLCNACHLRWKNQGRPAEGYSSTTFPPPHYSPSCLKRKRSLKSTVKSKKIKTEGMDLNLLSSDKCACCLKTETPTWRKGPSGKTLCNACGLKWAKEDTAKPASSLSSSFSSLSISKRVLLHHKKHYIQHGLYSEETRLGHAKQPFSFPLPIHQGEFILSKLVHFELPADILQERELGLIKGLQQRMPSFTRIRSNIFVERKPQTSVEPVVCHCVKPANDQPGCGDDCINRMLFYECDPKTCPCGDQCTNQRFQRKERKKELQIFQTKNRGWGLRSMVDIKKGDLVIEYRGEIISHQLCEERMCTIYVNEKNFYFLDYCNGEVIDACYKGTEARFINHSCDPNCHIEKWSLRGESHFGVFASRDIPALSELFYDYNFSTFNGSVESQQPCYCGAVKCRGTIGRKASSKKKLS
ncbi:uncharacterized protein B0P05DRAFT_560897 [Gilbertella persicaria]|uniref:uncharacterized protein n=1 Tax=Gilbertella persicaria TaxID=101096 RepID=UPI00221EDF54|nr:uncharacterized protein B0P05DRAFT_560897 [Gilbertella persicaria]KAI8054958.1 hypothetical protein B0P05DRAFT_560897 [Gilbertella persicaria]